MPVLVSLLKLTFYKRSFLIRGEEIEEIIPFPVWIIPFPVFNFFNTKIRDYKLGLSCAKLRIVKLGWKLIS